MKPEILNQYIGWPFAEGGRKKEGIDCLGLVIKYLNDQGYKGKSISNTGYVNNFRQTIKQIANLSLKEKNPVLRENDIIYFYSDKKAKIHCGVYLGYDKYLHTSDGLTSRISHLNSTARHRIKGVIRPSKEQEIILPAAGGVILTIFMVVSAIISAVSIVYAITAKPPGDLEGASPGGVGGTSPKYKFGKLRNTRSNELPVPLIYGKNRMAGNVVYSSPLSGGTTVYQFIGLGEGLIQSITDVRFNNKPWSDFPGTSYTAYLGTTAQNVDAIGSADVNGLRRLAYLALTFEASEKLPNIPTVTSVVEGLKVKTWTDPNWAGATYSQNPVACIRDYLLRLKEIGGAGLTTADIDNASFGASYDYCDVLVSDGAGGTEARYQLNYVIDTRRSVLDNVQDMLGTFGGMLIYKAGKLYLDVKKNVAISHTFSMSNIKAGTFSYGYISKENQINKVGVQYVDINQGDVKPIAWVDDFEDQAARGIVEKVYPALGIGKFSQAARLAWQILYDLKINPIYCKFETGINALDAEAGDIIQLSHDVPAWSNKQFLITAIGESGVDEVAVEALAYNSSVYNDGYGSGIVTYDYGSPPSAYDSPPDVSNFTVNVSRRTELYMAWDQPAPALEAIIRNYEIREGTTWATAVIVAILAANQFSYRMPILAAGTRTFHIKAISTFGIYSVNSSQDSVAITAIPMSNVIASKYLWAVPGMYGGTPSTDAHLEWTKNYNSNYYRRSVALETEDTMEEYESAAGTWANFGNQFLPATNPLVSSEETFTSEEIDMGSEVVGSVSLQIGTTDTPGDSSLAIYWRFGSASPLGGAYQLFASADYTFRYAQFQVRLKSNSPSVGNVYLDDLIVKVDVFDIFEYGSSVAIAVGGTAITFSEDFQVTPSITVTSQDSPLIPKVTGETKNGFTCTVYNSAGVDVGGVADWQAIGY